MKPFIYCIISTAALYCSQAAWCMEGMSGDQHVMMTPKDLEWKDAPASLPKGAQVAILEGDPTKAGPFTMRLKVPAGYRIPPHHHPAIEHVTVIDGNFQMGLGEKFDDKLLKDLSAGGFAVMPIGVRHFAASKDGGVVQVHGIGPWGIIYVNDQDDPRKQAK
jgi:quercetin dioxygenase-like cupin family protein